MVVNVKMKKPIKHLAVEIHMYLDMDVYTDPSEWPWDEILDFPNKSFSQDRAKISRVAVKELSHHDIETKE